MTSSLLDLSGRRALVTGGSRGIGFGIAEILVQHGAMVAVASLHRDHALGAADRIQGKYGGECIPLEMDVRNPESVTAAFAEFSALAGGAALDILVNNAGIANSIEFDDLDEEAWGRIMETNLNGVYRCCRAGAPLMTEGGSILNIASISGSMVNVPQFQANYNTSKAGVIHFSKSLAVEFAPRGIRVNSLSPGYTLTDMNRRPEVADLTKIWAERTPMKRLAEIDEIAAAALFLVSPMAGFITGHDLVVDGGITILC